MTTNDEYQHQLEKQRQTINYIQERLAYLNRLMFLIAALKQKQQDWLDLN